MLRYPIRVMLSADESELVVANSRSGTVSALDLEKGIVYQESYLCPEISDMHWEPVKKEGFFLILKIIACCVPFKTRREVLDSVILEDRR